MPESGALRWALRGIALQPDRVKTGSLGMPGVQLKDHYTSLFGAAKLRRCGFTIAAHANMFTPLFGIFFSLRDGVFEFVYA